MTIQAMDESATQGPGLVFAYGAFRQAISSLAGPAAAALGWRGCCADSDPAWRPLSVSVAGRRPTRRLWRAVAARSDVETRHVLQAWTFLRQAGIAPDPEHGKDVLGVVVSVPVGHGHDVLVAYRDRSVRYINFSGAAVVLDDPPHRIMDAAGELLQQGRVLADRIGPWTEAQLPPLPDGDARLLVLTPSGPHFGQAPYSRIGSDPMARPVLDAAFNLLTVVLSFASV
jgi:hypothetical protein